MRTLSQRALLFLVSGLLTLRADPPSGSQWRIAFEDNFSIPSLDTTKWNYYYPWGRTHNHLAYARSGNVTTASGVLYLKGQKENFGGMEYTTGVVNTDGRFHTTYGYLEARLRLPSTRGSWPAFWTLQQGWPPEIDIMEYPIWDFSAAHNEKYRYWWNFHWGPDWQEHYSTGAEVWQGADLSAGWHTYGVEWTGGFMKFYFDDAVKGQTTNTSAISQCANHYMLLNYAIGGWPGTPGSWPANGDTFDIDWVRVWKTGSSSTSTWSRDGNGEWDDNSDWEGDAPELASQIAGMGPLPTATAATVNWKGPRAMGFLNFTGAVNYTLGDGDETILLARRLDTDTSELNSSGTGTRRMRANLELRQATTIANTGTQPLVLDGILHGDGPLTLNAGALTLNPDSYFGGSVTVTGGSTMLLNGHLFGTETNGPAAAVTVTVNGGSHLSVSRLEQDSTLGLLSNNAARLVLDDAMLELRTGGDSYRGFTLGAGGTTLDIAAGGSVIMRDWPTDATTRVISTSGGRLTLSGSGTGEWRKALSGTSGLRKSGTGRWSVHEPQTFTGAVEVQSGELAIAPGGSLSTAAGITVRSGALLEVRGTPPALTLESGAKLRAVLDPGAGATATAVFTAPVNGQQTDFSLTLDALFAPQPGLWINVFDGTMTGAFRSVTLPPVPGAAWDTSRLYVDGTLRLTGTPVARQQTVISPGALCRAFVPGTVLPDNWAALTFADTAWTAGTTGLGYERTTGYDSLIGTDVETGMYSLTGTTLLRVPFTVARLTDFNALSLDMQYDDGFVAYLNGTEVARSNAAPGTPTGESLASAAVHDDWAVAWQSFNLTPFRHLLRSGANVLAIQGLNESPTSSDFLISPRLILHHDPATVPGFTGWIAYHNVLTGAAAAPAGNPDGDAWNNFQEFIHGQDPELRDSPPAPPLTSNTTAVPPGNIELLYLRRTDWAEQRLIYTIEQASSPVATTWLITNPTQISATATANPLIERVRALVPLPAGVSSQFYRVRVQQ